MKKHLSVLMWIARSSINKLLAVLLGMTAVQGLLFWNALEKWTQTGYVGLESIIEKSGIAWIMAVGFIIVTWALSRTGCNHGSHPGYTLQRLSITEKSVFIWQSIYNTVCFLILLCVQILLAVLFCKIYVREMDPAIIGEQTIFLAFYRNAFLHCLFPLEEVWLWIRNLLYAMGMGMAAAQYPFCQRRGKTIQSVHTLTCGVLAFFVRDLGSGVTDGFGVLLVISVVAMACYNVFVKGEEDEED